MLIRSPAVPRVIVVDPVRLLPRLWATAWSYLITAHALSDNTLKLRLGHIDAFYLFCDERFGHDALDDALSRRDAEKVQLMAESFYVSLTADPNYNSTAVQRWDSVQAFLQRLARRLSPSDHAWAGLAVLLPTMKVRRPKNGRVEFKRALPATTLSDLLAVAHPDSPRNPFRGHFVRERNWLIVNLLLLCGLRRGEALLLEVDSLKREIDPDTGELVHWLDVTTNFDYDPRLTKPSMKTRQSHRQIPISADLANLYDHYVDNVRVPSDDHPYLVTSSQGSPLSAESLTKLFEKFYRALSPAAQDRFFESSGGKEQISPHDLRHTCATARFRMFMRQDPNRDLALQRMRAFFGWSVTSQMPDHYARAAIQEDLMQTWNAHFDQRLDHLRSQAK